MHDLGLPSTLCVGLSMFRWGFPLGVLAFVAASPLGTAANAGPVMAVCAGQQYLTGPDGRIFCEQHWSGQANCTGFDQLPLGAGPVGPQPTKIILPVDPGPGGVVPPWEPHPISIYGWRLRFEAVPTSSDGSEVPKVTAGYAFLGNSYVHDTMGALDIVHKNEDAQFYSNGFHFQFPDSSQQSAHIDVHVRCNPHGLRYEVTGFVYYEVNPADRKAMPNGR